MQFFAGLADGDRTHEIGIELDHLDGGMKNQTRLLTASRPTRTIAHSAASVPKDRTDD